LQRQQLLARGRTLLRRRCRGRARRPRWNGTSMIKSAALPKRHRAAACSGHPTAI